ncbi:MAG: 1,6-anhydro-N-acetylmuramyl-L-alanine amidase AmpD [Gammaproteobacteria bacterium]|nr:1,6-anhydro-N-acetylmuramyl-L-alanine amidase AmpD [Gammaproteobacteria bacterium]
MHVKQNHWLSRVRNLRSPNRSKRPDPMDVALIVIHGISLPKGEFATGCVDRLFLNQLDVTSHGSFADLDGVRVSSHLLIDRVGRTTQYVPFDEQAWHAGDSSWRNRVRCNAFAIGIELEGTDDQPYADRQYSTLAKVTRALFEMYPRLSPDAIVGHQEVAPGRKTDPGPAFDWSRYLLKIAGPT